MLSLTLAAKNVRHNLTHLTQEFEFCLQFG